MITKNEINNLSKEELENFIKECSQKYYSGPSDVEDSIFDYAIERLRSADPENSILTTTGHGFDINSDTSKRIKYKHPYGNMNSIFDKPRDIESIPKSVASYEVLRLSAKLDGLSAELIYKDGKLVRALTRGNGIEGLDVTDKARIILKEDLDDQERNSDFTFTGSIRGEFIFNNKNWDRYKNLVDKDAKNARNTASGLIMKLDNENVDFLSLIPYKVIASEGDKYVFSTMEDMNRFLKEMFREIVPNEVIGFDILSQEYLESMFEIFKRDYPCDGCVLTGFSSLHKEPNNSYKFIECAYKFESEKAETEVINIEWNRTRTGKLTPVCRLKQVFISGTNVSRVAAFNADFVKKNKIGPGAIIEVMKSGEIIPYITNVIKESSEPCIPSVCPVCGEELVLDGADIWCKNPYCNANNEADLYHFSGVIGEVHGLGDSVKRQFFEDNNIKCVEDLYSRDLNEYIYPRTPSANKKIKEMMSILREPVDPVKGLIALNIPRLGYESAKKLVASDVIQYFDPYMHLLREDKESINKFIDCVGMATTKSILNNIDRAVRFSLLKIKSVEIEEVSEADIKGKVVITGKLNTCKRSEFEKIIKDAGYLLDGGIKKDTMYLITNTPNSGSSKNKKADELGVQKITEEEFLRIINKED